MNPFQYGKVVSHPYFVNREEELKDISNTLQGGNNVILHAPRRYGKTSLMMKVLAELNTDNAVYLDLFSVTSVNSFINVYLNKILQTQKYSIQSLSTKVSKLLRGITPSVSFDSWGKPAWSFQLTSSADEQRTLTDVLELPQKLIKADKRFFVVFDEFQEVSKLNGGGFEKQLRSVIQHQQNVSYVFMGSKTHLLMQMFTSKERALYHSGKLVSLNKVAKERMHAYIKNRFLHTGIEFSDALIDRLIDITDNIPYYNQFLAAQLWQVVQGGTSGRSEQELLDDAVDSILSNQDEYYFSLFEKMTLYQRAVTKAISLDNKSIFSQEYHDRHNLTSPSSTKRAGDSLVEHGVLEKIGKQYYFSDPFFPKWLALRNYA